MRTVAFRALSRSERKYIDQVSSVIDAVAAINGLGAKARRLAITARRLLEAQEFQEAADLFERIAGFQRAQVKVCTPAITASLAAAASCRFRAGDAVRGAKLTRTAVRPYLRRRTQSAKKAKA
jgi:hypothetical protein